MDARAFIEAYRAANERLDVEAAAAFYATPLAIATRQRGWIVSNAEELRVELAQMFDFYRYNGVARLETVGLALSREDTAVALATLDLRALDGEGRQVARFQTTYALGDPGGERRITGVVVHNDVFPRDALSAEALAALRRGA